jgi:hypothetical protein
MSKLKRVGFGSKLKVESLERRLLLSGDVSVTVRFGDLIVKGDHADNSIAISPGGQEGEYVVEGFDDTLINGKDVPVVVKGVDDDFLIKMKHGDDIVILGQPDFINEGSVPLVVPDDCTIYTRAGVDVVLLGGVNVGDDLVIRTGKHADGAALLDTTVGDDARVYMGNGNDALGIDRVGPTDTIDPQLDLVVQRALDFVGENGEDGLLFGHTEIADDLFASMGSGDDRVGVASCSVGDDFTLRTGSGNDDTSFSALMVDDYFRVYAGSGNDTVGTEADDFSFGANARQVRIYAGGGQDWVGIGESTVKRELEVNMRGNQDSLKIWGTVVGKETDVNGGTAKDSLFIEDKDDLAGLKIKNFEELDVH